MDQNVSFLRSDNFVERELGGAKVLVPINQFGVEVQSIYTLNETAAAIWSLLSEKRTLDDLTIALEARYFDTEGQIRDDVESLLVEFEKESFITKSGG